MEIRKRFFLSATWEQVLLAMLFSLFLFMGVVRAAEIPGYLMYNVVGDVPSTARSAGDIGFKKDLAADSQGNVYVLDLVHSSQVPWQVNSYPLKGGKVQPQPNLWKIDSSGRYVQFLQPRFYSSLYRNTYGAYDMTSIAIDSSDNLLFDSRPVFNPFTGRFSLSSVVYIGPSTGNSVMTLFSEANGIISEIQVDSKDNVIYRLNRGFSYIIKKRAPNGSIVTLVSFPPGASVHLIGLDNSDNIYYTDGILSPTRTTNIYRISPQGVTSSVKVQGGPFEVLDEGPNGKLYLGQSGGDVWKFDFITGKIDLLRTMMVTYPVGLGGKPKPGLGAGFRYSPSVSFKSPFVFDSRGVLHTFDGNGAFSSMINTSKIAHYPYPDVALKPLSASASKPANIKMLFSATNPWSGAPITGLNRSHFSLKVDGINALVPEAFFDIRPLPQSTKAIGKKVIMFDISSSITPAILALMKQAVIGMLVDVKGKSRLLPGETVSIWAFDDIVRLKQPFTSNVALLKKAINNLKIGGASTNLYGAVVSGMRSISTTYKNNQLTYGYMLVVTDGGDTAGIKTLAQAKASKGNNGLYVLLTQYVSPTTTLMKSLRTLTGSAGYILEGNLRFTNSLQFVTPLLERFRVASTGFPKSLYTMEYVTPLRGFGRHTATLAVANNYYNTVANVSFNPGALGFRNPRPSLAIFGPDLLALNGSVTLEGVTKFVSPLATAHAWSIDKPSLATIITNPLNPSFVTIMAKPGRSGMVTVSLKDRNYPRLLAKHSLFISDVGFIGMNNTGQKIIVNVGQIRQIEASTPGVASSSYTWKIANSAIATVIRYGSSQFAGIKGRKAGRTKLTVIDMANGKTFTTTILVKKTSSKLSRPALLRAQALRGKIKLILRNNVKGEQGYVVQRRVGRRGTFKVLGHMRANKTVYIDRKVSKRIRYYYRVYAYKGKIRSPLSRVVSATAK